MKDINRIDCLQKKIIRGLKQVAIAYINDKINSSRNIKTIRRELRNVMSGTPWKKSAELLKWIKEILIKPFGVKNNTEEYKEMIAQSASIIFKTKIKYILLKFSSIELGFADKKNLTDDDKDKIRAYSDSMEKMVRKFK